MEHALSSRYRHSRRTTLWSRTLAAVSVVVLMLGVGLCLVGGADDVLDCDGMLLHPCALAAMSSLAPLLLGGLLANGAPPLNPIRVISEAALRSLDPPPKLALRP